MTDSKHIDPAASYSRNSVGEDKPCLRCLRVNMPPKRILASMKARLTAESYKYLTDSEEFKPLKEIWDKWPGDESIDEILAALKRMD